MTTSTDKILNIIEIIKHTDETLEIIENTRSKVFNEVINTIHRLSYDECLILLDKSNDIPEKYMLKYLKEHGIYGGLKNNASINQLEYIL